MILNEYGSDFIQDKMLSEQYYGKNKSLEQIDRLFDKAIDIVNTKSKNVVGKSFNDIGELKKLEPKLESLVQTLFNFSDVDIQFQTLGALNAFTTGSLNIVNTITYNEKYKKIKTPTGIQFKNKVKPIQIVIGKEILQSEGVTGRILTGVLLHEIGHNFYYEDTLSYAVGRVLTLVRLIIATSVNPMFATNLLSFTSDKYKQLIVKGTNINQKMFKDNDATQRYITGFFGFVFTNFNILLGIGSGPVAIVQNTVRSLASLFTAVFNPFRSTAFREEQFADNFATAYGYGKEVLEFERIVLKGDNAWCLKVLNKNKFTAMYTDFIVNSNQLFGSFGDVHPDAISRCIDQITYLEKNLNLVPNKNQRDKIKKDLEEAKKTYADMIKDIKEDKNFANSGKILSQKILEKNIDKKGALSYRVTKKGNSSGDWKALV